MKSLLAGAVSALMSVSGASAGSGHETPAASPPLEFLFETRGVYSLVASPGRVTDIALEPGERLVDTNPIAAGDTARWIIGDTSSGQGSERRVHVLVKPVSADLSTNLVINTDRRTYFLDLRASSKGFLTQVSWRYPALPVVAARAALPASAPAPRALSFGYRLRGKSAFRPERVYDDGVRTWIVFASGATLAGLPPLYALGPDGKTAELINYRIEGRSLVVDHLIDRVELRMGVRKRAERIRIERAPEAGQ